LIFAKSKTNGWLVNSTHFSNQKKMANLSIGASMKHVISGKKNHVLLAAWKFLRLFSRMEMENDHFKRLKSSSMTPMFLEQYPSGKFEG